MPREKQDEVVSTDGGFEKHKRTVVERGTPKSTFYLMPTRENFSSFLDQCASLDKDGMKATEFVNWLFPVDKDDQPTVDEDESAADWLYRHVNRMLETAASQAIYTSIAAESTIVTLGKDNKKDILDMKLDVAIRAINGMRGNIAGRAYSLAEAAFDVEGTDKDNAEYAKARADAIAAAEKSVGYGPWKVAARKFVEGYVKDGKPFAAVAREENNMLVKL